MTKLLKDAIFEQLKFNLPQDDYFGWEDYLITHYLKLLYDEIETQAKYVEEKPHKAWYAFNDILNLEVKEPYEAPTVEPLIKMSHEVNYDK